MVTSPFHTFDPWDAEKATRAEAALVAAATGDDGPFVAMLADDPGLAERYEVSPDSIRSDVPWDDGTLLWIAGSPPDPKGRYQPWSLERQRVRERLGRWPLGEGSSLVYVMDHIRPPRDGGLGCIITHLEHLLQRPGPLGGAEAYAVGAAGLELRGYLTAAEVAELRKDLQQIRFGIAADEPLDGGVRDAISLLVDLFRAAERYKVGLVMRIHR